MKLWMRIAMPVATVMTLTVSAHAQNYGMGLYGGMQSCPYNYGAAEGSSSIQDDIAEKQDAIKEAKEQIKSKTSELKSSDRRKKRSRDDIEEVVASAYTEQIFYHIDNSAKACEYKGLGEAAVQGQQGDTPVSTCAGSTTDTEISGFTADQWKGLVDNKNPGVVNGKVCTGVYRVQEKGRRTEQDCQKALVEYKKESDKSKKLAKEIEDLKRGIENMKDDIADLKKDAREEQREAAREARENPEGSYCPTCGGSYSYRRPETNWGSVLANVGVGLAATYMGSRSQQMISDNNASIGFPSNPYPSWGFGLPFLLNGALEAVGGGGYGAIGGGIGAGGFGCAGNNGGAYGMMGPFGGANGNGMWGNPYAMGGNPYGGGMYAPGMGPWGMNGPMGGMMGGFPGGMMISGGMGMMMGSMMPGMMSGGMMPGMMTGGMMPGMMMPGMMASGGIGMMMPGMMSGGMMPGMMTGGMMPGMMVGGMAGGMMPGMMSGGMMGGLGAMQMQQQMMQMQMNQYQQYVQQQYQKQQVTASLQQELYGLMYRIQQVQYGFGGDYLSGGIGGIGGSIGAGVVPAPGYGGGGYNGGYPGAGSGAIPAPGYNNGVGGGTGNGGVILAPR